MSALEAFVVGASTFAAPRRSLGFASRVRARERVRPPNFRRSSFVSLNFGEKVARGRRHQSQIARSLEESEALRDPPVDLIRIARRVADRDDVRGALLPRAVLRREASLPSRGSRRWRDPIVGVIAGAAALAVVWSALSRPAPGRSAADELAARAGEAHAGNAVTAILADFRGLDTLGEITVLAVALVGLAVLLRRGRLR